MIYYSKTTSGFYDSNLHGKNIPADAVAITAEEHQALMSGQSSGRMIIADQQGHPCLAPVKPGPDYAWRGSVWAIDFDRQKKRAINLMQMHMDRKAQQYGYDNILSAKSYTSSTNAKWRAEGEAFRDWQDAVWSFGLALLGSVEAGTNTLTTDADLLAALPAFPLD